MTIQQYINQLTTNFEKLGLTKVGQEDSLTGNTFKVCFINKYELHRQQELLGTPPGNKKKPKPAK
ncbi:hypothetical protein MKQ68_23130 [Chitinophaga horti]|uniref:Uncharacterized protein n=1 Tax=Chitinophaga horti TaxID=2920382 RepID=A0ABY6J2W0_9BACT|nr:hypothetical protein [Chitinophaga horti]UYQ92977.1 hypothetical protein MKQ68_23130 [Chitinophaga horti]